MTGDSDEFSFIERLRDRVSHRPQTSVGIGDDAALLKTSGSGVLVAVDVLTEGVHFDLRVADPKSVGRKALAVNLSDIAAMAGLPKASVVGLVLPKDRGSQLADPVMDGLLELAGEFDVDIIGGDTNTWSGPLVISVTVLGEPTAQGAVTRQGARPGDWLFVTGALGGSLAGRHLKFVPRVREAQQLLSAVTLHAMIDLSDGLASDLRHLARESNVGFVIEAETLPIHDDVSSKLPDERWQRALCDGEDFELCFTVSEADGRRLLERSPLSIPLSHIGIATDDALLRMRLPDGSLIDLPEGGWRHRFGAS